MNEERTSHFLSYVKMCILIHMYSMKAKGGLLEGRRGTSRDGRKPRVANVRRGK